MKWEMNSEPRSEVMCPGTPCLKKTWRTKRLASWTAVRVLWVGMKIPCLESQSTMTRMAVCPAEAGSCSIRSIDMESHGRSGMGRGLRRP